MPPKRKNTQTDAAKSAKVKAVEEAPSRPRRNRVVTSYNEEYSDEAPKTTKSRGRNAGDAKDKKITKAAAKGEVKVKGKRGRKKKLVEIPEVDEDEEVEVKAPTGRKHKDEKQDEVDEEDEVEVKSKNEAEKEEEKEEEDEVEVKVAKGRKKKVEKPEVDDDEGEVEVKAAATQGRKNKVEKEEEKEEEEEEEEEEEVDEEEVKVKIAKGRKKKEDAVEEKPKKNGKEAAKKVPIPRVKPPTNYDAINFDDCTRKNENGKEWNFKISNWNVDGVRAWVSKGGLDFVEHEKPDVFCLQETKCSEDKLPYEASELDGYKTYWVCSEKDGYAGVGLFTKIEPISVQYGLNDKELDTEGRMITAEFEKFYVVSVYVPNSGRALITMPKRMKWNEIFRKFIAELDKKKPVIVCGDMNVSHAEIDLSNPKTNTKNAGFTKEERDGMTEFLSGGYIDTFRKIYPDKRQAYTFWTYMSNCRTKNIGWRLDYFIVSERFMDNVCDNIIRNQVFGSDHCPITLFLNV